MRSRKIAGALAAVLAVMLTAGATDMKALAAEEQNPEFTVEVQSEVLNREDNFAPVPETVAQSSSESDTAASKISSGNPEPVTESVTEAPTPAGSSKPATEPAVSVPPETTTPVTEPIIPATESTPEAPTPVTPSPEPSVPATEPVTVPATEPVTSAPSTDPATPAPPETTPPATESPTSTSLHLGIDNRHLYSSMESTYSQGYTPSTTVSSATLVVPFTADGPLKNDRLTVSLEFDSSGTVPFEMKNYQKDVDKKTVYFDQKGKALKEKAGAAEIAEAYVYRVKLQFLSTAEPGQYPVTVKALGYTEKGEKVTLEYRLFVRISEKDDSDVVVIGGDEPNGGGGDYSGGGGSAETEKSSISLKCFWILVTCPAKRSKREARRL